MSQIFTIFILFLISFFSYIFSISPLSYLTPQLIAILSIVLVLLIIFKKSLVFNLIALIINILVFYTNGLNSPLFFLVYFLLFVIAFQNSPVISLSYSLMLIIFLSQSLNSVTSIFPLLSLLFITPLAWFISKQHLENIKLNSDISKDETDIILWLSLKFKTSITQIIDSVSLLLSNPNVTYPQKEELHKIKDSAKYLLKSSEKLTEEIENEN
jgi:hypothetical protein